MVFDPSLTVISVRWGLFPLTELFLRKVGHIFVDLTH